LTQPWLGTDGISVGANHCATRSTLGIKIAALPGRTRIARHAPRRRKADLRLNSGGLHNRNGDEIARNAITQLLSRDTAASKVCSILRLTLRNHEAVGNLAIINIGESCEKLFSKSAFLKAIAFALLLAIGHVCSQTHGGATATSGRYLR
jgi:hypothetical protein